MSASAVLRAVVGRSKGNGARSNFAQLRCFIFPYMLMKDMHVLELLKIDLDFQILFTNRRLTDETLVITSVKMNVG